MRNAFVKELCHEAEKNKKIWLLTADLGFSALEPFIKKFPDRYINVGVAEQNMIGVAAGLALSGYKVFVYSIANFATLRCLEQIRNDVCYHHLDVCVVSVGSGFSYATQGYTHHGLEDLNMMRGLPNMSVLSPADPNETAAAVKLVCQKKAPAYLRLGKAGEAVLYQNKGIKDWGRVVRVKSGNDVLILATGHILSQAIEAAKRATNSGISTAVWSVPFIKPLDQKSLLEAAKKYSLIVTLEEAQIFGGLGSAVAEILAETKNCKAKLHRMGVEDTILYEAHEQQTAYDFFGLNAVSIFRQIKKELR